MNAGFSSRGTSPQTVTQLPQRDEAIMSDLDITPGFSNSDEAKDAPQDVHPDVAEPEALDPGYSNAKAVKGADSKVVDDNTTEDKVVKKTAAKKS